MTDIIAKTVTLLVDGAEQDFTLRTPTVFAREVLLELALEAGIDVFNAGRIPEGVVNPKGLADNLATLDAMSRETRRTAEWKTTRAEAAAKVDALPTSPAELAKLQREANLAKMRSTSENMKAVTAMLAALLTDAAEKDPVTHRPLYVYSREEASAMIPSDAMEAVFNTVGSLWPDDSKEATPGNPPAAPAAE
jgi:hypothetical protein